MDKCSHDSEGNIQPCSDMDTIIKSTSSKIIVASVINENIELKEPYLFYKYGRKRKEKKALHFCPFCGYDILKGAKLSLEVARGGEK